MGQINFWEFVQFLHSSDFEDLFVLKDLSVVNTVLAALEEFLMVRDSLLDRVLVRGRSQRDCP